jgi:dihydroorotate dehydrogenase (NAD+) catalytic subunit
MINVVVAQLRKIGLTVDLAGMQLANPTVLASGVLGYSAETVENVIRGGAGAAVTKSVGLKPREGYSNPTVVQVSCGLINAMGLPNPGMKEYVKEFKRIKAAVRNVPLIFSIYGYSAEEYATIAHSATAGGADAVELNVSCPHVKDTGSEIGQCSETVVEVVKKVKACVSRPVFVKLSPNVTSVADIAEAAVKAGADGLTIMNTVRAMAIDVDTAMPVLSNRFGGLSGPAVKPVALRCVYETFERVKVPIMGCGGVMDWRDAVEFLLAGASAVQIGTAVSLNGPNVFRRVALGIDKYLKSKHFTKVEHIVGLSHRR